jgi:hypothetical protein
MSFDAYSTSQSEGTHKEIDFDALNKYVVEKAGLQEREVLVGYVSGIVDLGTQEQEDAEMEFKGSEEEEAEAIAEYPDTTYFKDGIDYRSKKKIRLKCWTQKPVQSVALSVDFPDIIIDKGEFFGESKPLPLRLWLGGQFYIKDAGMVVGRPTPLKITKKTGVWSFAQNHLLHKMAVAGKLIEPDGVFLPQDIDQLLGKAFQFNTQVFFKKNKSSGVEYYTEYVNFSSALSRSQEEPEQLTTPFIVEFYEKNEEESVKQLRNHVVNTIKRASNYEGSVIEGEILEWKTFTKAPAEKAEGKAEEAPSEAAAENMTKVKHKTTTEDFDDYDDDIPF